jgi:hypothetical protein
VYACDNVCVCEGRGNGGGSGKFDRKMVQGSRDI